jgi:steroid 5-alpha reductase family enzyme
METLDATTHQKPLWEITKIYLIIGMSGYLAYDYIPLETEMLRFLAADLVMTIMAFIFSVYKKNSSVYDAYWSVIPFYFVLQWFLNSYIVWGAAEYLTAFSISFWSWRLTHNWYRSWTGWDHEDWRYVNFRNQFGKLFPLINFSAIHLYPTLIVFLSMTGLFFLFDGAEKEINSLIIIGNIIAIIGTFFELFADNTLYHYRNKVDRVKGSSIREGLWKYSRNPNYLGEILFWIGLAIVGFGASAPLWTGLGALGMLLMFIFASIPLKEARQMKTRTDFETYKKEVSMLIPLPPKK